MADIDTFDGALAAIIEWSEAICRRDPELARLQRRGQCARRLLESAWAQAYEADTATTPARCSRGSRD
jgi:hypothetical protein